MCGRFTLTADAEGMAAFFELASPVPPLTRRYNVAPSQMVAMVGLKPDGRRGLALLKWGLGPYWSETRKPKRQPITVRAESAAWKFGEQLRGRRSLNPTDGFYEFIWAFSRPAGLA